MSSLESYKEQGGTFGSIEDCTEYYKLFNYFKSLPERERFSVNLLSLPTVNQIISFIRKVIRTSERLKEFVNGDWFCKIGLLRESKAIAHRLNALVYLVNIRCQVIVPEKWSPKWGYKLNEEVVSFTPNDFYAGNEFNAYFNLVVKPDLDSINLSSVGLYNTIPIMSVFRLFVLLEDEKLLRSAIRQFISVLTTSITPVEKVQDLLFTSISEFEIFTPYAEELIELCKSNYCGTLFDLMLVNTTVSDEAIEHVKNSNGSEEITTPDNLRGDIFRLFKESKPHKEQIEVKQGKQFSDKQQMVSNLCKDLFIKRYLNTGITLSNVIKSLESDGFPKEVILKTITVVLKDVTWVE